MNVTWGGGSSSVFSRALKALAESACASSIMYTLCFSSRGMNRACSIMSRISSTPVLLAASSSIISAHSPALILQERQQPQGSPSMGSSQFTALASMRAALVLPVPLVPAKR